MIDGTPGEIALFLIRVFGEEARDIARDRARASDQPGEWGMVMAEIDRLLGDAAEKRPRVVH